ncbi:cysteine--tRNA ligase [Enterobacteriaceae endosymbiont of Macroplea appendiculata]|uniref:cysteine--tRNA ligase n=1 Tax=Enterobacteriaceae endosymbiont of Macroplea appendiculata TaxID=2675790 RepID=UPI001448F07C|nr:cysteine--tRNA ligase [Enterobacteriaceae endosymbiont of Macroplea appendiculata]QJC30665.1 cysteine--tRNA ligase [Enterobacteriaceae endosymbiont of Macroplea appendiculata]
MLKIFNTLSKKKETFRTITPKHIKMYVCGITPYDTCHIGHGRTFIIFDIMIRYFQFLGYTITYVRNITDIDDKIIKLVKNNNMQYMQKIVSNIISLMYMDFNKLNIIHPTIEPKVTKHINEIIQFIQILLKKQHAYLANNGDVVFNIASYQHYGQLSRQNTHKNFLNINFVDISFKKRGQDFVLWKKCLKEQIGWSSPWGYGRPGWHIECSAISYKYLGHNFDIHGGGNDLIFPHHENEIAQSQCIHPFFNVNFWIHTGMIIINNKKMSKTLQNDIKLKDILLKYNNEVIRYFFTITHYRRPIIFHEEKLQNACIVMKKLYRAIYNINEIKEINIQNIPFKNLEKQFYDAMNDDFNTPKAYSILFKISHDINIAYHKKNFILQQHLMLLLKKLGNILGILFYNPKYYFKNHTTKILHKLEIEQLIQKRCIARKKKLWKEADNIRNFLKKNNIFLEDLHDKTIWKI